MKTSQFLLATALLASGAAIFPATARAVVLEQKWRAGATLNYNTQLAGNVNLQIPADVPFLLAGVPLDIEVQGKGKTQLETLRVDGAGTGTIAVKMPLFDFTAQTFGQTMKVALKDGKSRVTLNGRPMQWGQNWGERLSQSNAALQIGKDARIKGVQSLSSDGKFEGKPADENPTETAPEKAIDQTALIVSLVARALPALLPSGDVETGANWNSKLDFPALAPTDENGAPLPLGTFEMTLKGEEIVDNQKLWRIGVKGQLEIDGTKLPAPPAQTNGNARPTPPRLQNAKQTVEGDLWFDAAAGQFARAELILGSNASTRFANKNGEFGEPSWFDFTGTLRLDLEKNA